MAQYPSYAAATLVAEMPVDDGVVLHGVEYAQVSGPLLEPLPSWPSALPPSSRPSPR